MDTLIPSLYRDYGLYINQSRALPLDVDGLKPVERRVLLSTYQIAREKHIKSARIDGHTIGHFHPHGSSYSTIVQLVNQGFLEGQGNFGNNIGVEPSPAAAMRYTECKLSKRVYDIAFRLIDSVKWIESELDEEPEHIPTMFPFCLLGRDYSTGIGFGYKTLFPSYSMDDLRKRLMFLIGKTKEKPMIKPVSDCKILSSNVELEQLLTTGKATISFQGIFKVDNARCKAVIKTWPPGKRFESILAKFEKELLNQDIGFTDESSSENHGTHIVFEGYKLLGLDTYFTTGEDETRAWTIKKGSTAPVAGMAIHTDFKDKFIRAEVVFWNDLLESGSYGEARSKGKVRTEGKEYVVKNGDVIEFKI